MPRTSRCTIDPALAAVALVGLAGAVIGFRAFRSIGDRQFQHALSLALLIAGGVLVVR